MEERLLSHPCRNYKDAARMGHPQVVQDAAGFVLAGGRSSRMGTDKALVELAGKPLIQHSLDALREAGLATAIAGTRSDLARFAPVVEDLSLGLGPLAGVCAALRSSTARWAVFLSVDLPLIPASLIRVLLDHAQITESAVTLASVNGFPQTFPAVIDRAALPVFEAELAAGRGGCFAAFWAGAASLGRTPSILPVEYLAQTGAVSHPAGLPLALWFLNVNTPADLGQARRVLIRCDRVS